MGYRRAFLAVLAVFVAAGCQVRTDVTVSMEDDGSGTVEVAVGLDEEAVAKVPDLDGSGVSNTADLVKLVRVEDLTAAGWTIGEPSEPDSDGFVWVNTTKPFATPDEATQILEDLTGPGGGLRSLELERKASYGSTEYGFSGVADLSGGLEAFGDEGLASALDGEPLGQDAAAIEQRLGQPLAEMVKLSVRVELPGGTAEAWAPELGGEPVDMMLDVVVYDRIVLGLTVVAVGCLVALGVVLLLRRRAPS